MYELIFDLAVVLIFLALLFSATGRYKRYLEYYPQSRKALIWGGVLLVLAGGTNLLFTLNQNNASFGIVGQQILLATGMVAYIFGGALVIFGLIRCCRSLVKIKNNATLRLRQLACLKALLSVTQRRGELDGMLKESLSQLMNVMGYRMGVIFKPTFCSSDMVLVAHAGVSVQNLFALYDLHFKNAWYKEAKSSRKVTVTTDVKNLPEYGTVFSEKDGIHSFACIPITFSGKILGLLGLYDTNINRFSYQEIRFLTSVGETLGMAAKQILVSQTNKRRKEYISATENLLKITEGNISLEDVFSKISAELKKAIEFDHLTLALADGPNQISKTISVGNSGGILVESKTDSNFGGKVIREVMASGKVRIHGDVVAGEGKEGNLSPIWGMRSSIILPLWAEGSICGVLSLGHKKPNFYSADDVNWLGLFRTSLSQIILKGKLKSKLEREKSLNRSVREFESKLVEDKELKDLVLEVASSLVTDLPRSFARVTLLSKGKDQLLNCAVRQIRPEGIDLKNETHFSLNDLPWHRLVLESKRPMLVNQSEPESLMSNQEAQLIMDRRIGSALLVPLTLNDRAVGIISVGEMRGWDRQPLTKPEVDFIKHKADQLSLALKEALLQRSNRHLSEKLNRLERSKKSMEFTSKGSVKLWDLSYRIANPLTSIRGSAELLRMKEPSLSPHSLKYLNNIERGVDRIQECLERFLDSAEQSILPEEQKQAVLS
jgi:GAF domain-containing protein